MHPCAPCHPKEVEGFATSAMAHSLSVASAQQPSGSFEHASSGTRFASQNIGSEMWQTLERHGEAERLQIQYVVGSGSHAYGFLAQVGNHLFQSPISYYTKRGLWDMAPGYEDASAPDFSRPVTEECLICHSGKPLPLPDTLNSYQNPAFAGMGLQCDRCHGDAERHLKNPVPGTIINPTKLAAAERDSVCEQCHLAGVVRIPNPGKTIADFRAGERVEDAYTVYVAESGPETSIKVISHSEQLAMSKCARSSGGRLWCGTCHNPHETPTRPAEYFRERCLTCHAATLTSAHAAPGRDCIACHIPQRPAKDGGHTAFTDHRISRRPELEALAAPPAALVAWREPGQKVRDRNLALALVTAGVESGTPDEVIRGFRMLMRMEKDLSGDSAALTTLGTVLLKGKQPVEAEQRFARALTLRPNYAPYEVNMAVALLDEGNAAEATKHLERALEMDPLLQQAVELLNHAYLLRNENAKAEAVISRYRRAMGITLEASK